MILLDTHVVQWLISDSPRLSKPAVAAIRRARSSDVIVKPITPTIAALATQFPEDYSHDPADRLIGATARAEGLALVTRDDRIRSSPLLKTIW